MGRNWRCGSGARRGLHHGHPSAPSHFCRADGTCGPAGIDADGPDGISDGGSGRSSGACTPNHDGTSAPPKCRSPRADGELSGSRRARRGTPRAPRAPTARASWYALRRARERRGHAGGADRTAGTWWASDPGSRPRRTGRRCGGSDLIGVFHVDSTASRCSASCRPTGSYPYTEITLRPAGADPRAAVPRGRYLDVLEHGLRLRQRRVVNYTEKYVSRSTRSAR